tara:strand:+ start:449 stop:664 length:216 start_codon:yes stop_codon:yes gene_type:complete
LFHYIIISNLKNKSIFLYLNGLLILIKVGGYIKETLINNRKSHKGKTIVVSKDKFPKKDNFYVYDKNDILK